jgi:hypothetical protein
MTQETPPISGHELEVRDALRLIKTEFGYEFASLIFQRTETMRLEAIAAQAPLKARIEDLERVLENLLPDAEDARLLVQGSSTSTRLGVSIYDARETLHDEAVTEDKPILLPDQAHTPPDHMIRLELSASDGTAILFVRDVDAENLVKCWQAYHSDGPRPYSGTPEPQSPPPIATLPSYYRDTRLPNIFHIDISTISQIQLSHVTWHPQSGYTTMIKGDKSDCKSCV